MKIVRIVRILIQVFVSLDLSADDPCFFDRPQIVRRAMIVRRDWIADDDRPQDRPQDRPHSFPLFHWT